MVVLLFMNRIWLFILMIFLLVLVCVGWVLGVVVS